MLDKIARDLGAIESWLRRDRQVRTISAHVDRNAGQVRRARERQAPERIASLYDLGGEGA